jgi:hypothetical protein
MGKKFPLPRGEGIKGGSIGNKRISEFNAQTLLF